MQVGCGGKNRFWPSLRPTDTRSLTAATLETRLTVSKT